MGAIVLAHGWFFKSKDTIFQGMYSSSNKRKGKDSNNHKQSHHCIHKIAGLHLLFLWRIILNSVFGRMNNKTCRKRPYPWSNAALARSPFKTRKGVHTRGFTARSSLKSMGRLPRSNGCYVLGDKYTNFFGGKKLNR
jgi:hypothetical protein